MALPASGRPVRARRIAARLALDPAGSVRLLADQLEAYWHLALAPHWPRIHAVCATDAAAAARSMGERGVRAALAGLHRSLHWDGDTLCVQKHYEATVHLNGQGLVLAPNIFVWPRIASVSDPPWQPTLFYPARGAAALWEATSPAKPATTLLGRTRTEVLVRLGNPATTTAVAASVGVSPATASHHLGVLAGAGLASATRAGREVLYVRTPLGDDLLHHCSTVERYSVSRD